MGRADLGAAVSAVRDRDVVANGLRHHLLETDGEAGREVLLLHGYLDLARSFVEVIEALAAQGYRVIAPDFRGHGDTDRTPPGSYYHYMDYVADLDALFEVLGLARAHVVAHSMGGGVATRFAGARPERVRSLCLLEGVGPPAMPADVAPDRTTAWLDGLAKLRRRGPRPMATIDDVMARMRVSHPALDVETLRHVATISTRALPEGGYVFRFDPLHQTTSPMRYDAEAVDAFLPRITCPVMHIDGGEITAWPDLAARATRYPNARFVTLEGAGHMMHWTRPAETSAAVLAFLADRK